MLYKLRSEGLEGIRLLQHTATALFLRPWAHATHKADCYAQNTTSRNFLSIILRAEALQKRESRVSCLCTETTRFQL